MFCLAVHRWGVSHGDATGLLQLGNRVSTVMVAFDDGGSDDAIWLLYEVMVLLGLVAVVERIRERWWKTGLMKKKKKKIG